MHRRPGRTRTSRRDRPVRHSRIRIGSVLQQSVQAAPKRALSGYPEPAQSVQPRAARTRSAVGPGSARLPRVTQRSDRIGCCGQSCPVRPPRRRGSPAMPGSPAMRGSAAMRGSPATPHPRPSLPRRGFERPVGNWSRPDAWRQPPARSPGNTSTGWMRLCTGSSRAASGRSPARCSRGSRPCPQQSIAPVSQPAARSRCRPRPPAPGERRRPEARVARRLSPARQPDRPFIDRPADVAGSRRRQVTNDPATRTLPRGRRLPCLQRGVRQPSCCRRPGRPGR